MPAYRNAAKKDYDVPPFVAAEAIMVNVSGEIVFLVDKVIF